MQEKRSQDLDRRMMKVSCPTEYKLQCQNWTNDVLGWEVCWSTWFPIKYGVLDEAAQRTRGFLRREKRTSKLIVGYLSDAELCTASGCFEAWNLLIVVSIGPLCVYMFFIESQCSGFVCEQPADSHMFFRSMAVSLVCLFFSSHVVSHTVHPPSPLKQAFPPLHSVPHWGF